MAQGGLLLLHIALNLGLDSVIVPLHTMPLIPVVVSVVVEREVGVEQLSRKSVVVVVDRHCLLLFA